MARGSEVRVVGLIDFRRELKALEGDTNWARELTKVHQKVARKGASAARAEASAMGGQQRHFASSIGGRGLATSARIEVSGEANAVFWGTKGKGTGWNTEFGTTQNPPWVGASWDTGVAGEGPYAINDAIAKNVEEIVDFYSEMLDDLARRAFPD